MTETIDSALAKQAMIAYCTKKGALAFGVADVDALEKIAPKGHGPRDMLPRVKSVISIGVGGGTRVPGLQMPRPLPTLATPKPQLIALPTGSPS